MGFSREEYWSSLPFPSPVDHVLLELSTMTLPFWVVLHGMTHSFTELDKAVCGQWSVWLIFCGCGSHSVCPLMDKDKRLLEASWWEGLAVGASRSWADGWSHSQSILNPIFCSWLGLCSLPVSLAWGQTMVGVMAVMVTSFKRTYSRTALFSAPMPQQATVNPCLCQRPLDTQKQVWLGL